MATTDTDVPVTPIYAIAITPTGAVVDGHTLFTATSEAARVAALAEIRVKAALHGRSVRVNAYELDGTVLPLVVAVDGTVITLPSPHPEPAPTPPNRVPGALVEPEPDPGSTQPDDEWTGPLPHSYQDHYAKLWNMGVSGDLPAALTSAWDLEKQFTTTFGPRHPYTVRVLTVRAWLTLRQHRGSPGTVRLLIYTALCRREAQAQPAAETDRLITTALGEWQQLTAGTPTYAMDLSSHLLRLMGHLPQQAAQVEQWVEEHRMSLAHLEHDGWPAP
jgi:hypothetical protein